MVFVAEFVVEFVVEVVPDEFAGAGKAVETKSEDAAEFVVDFMKEGVVAVVAELTAVGGCRRGVSDRRGCRGGVSSSPRSHTVIAQRQSWSHCEY